LKRIVGSWREEGLFQILKKKIMMMMMMNLQLIDIHVHADRQLHVDNGKMP